MSIEKEKRVGEIYMRQIRLAAPLISDPVLQEYVSGIGQQLVRNTDGVKFPFEFFLINQSSINAFAFFGGHIGVHTGLIAAAQTESELAAVLGHEIAHITQRHMIRRMQEQQRSTPLTIASMIGAILLGIANPEAGAAGLYTAVGASAQSQINYTRAYEQEADRIGMQTLYHAGFDPKAAPNFFARLAEQYRYTSKPPEMLLTHPLPESRIADTRSRAAALPSVDVAPSLNFMLAKARVQARYTHDKSASEFAQMAQSTQLFQQRAGRYGLAIIALDKGNPQQAQDYLKPLLDDDPQNVFYLDVETDILLGLGDAQAAQDMLRTAYERRPNEQTITMNLANAALKNHNPQLAIAVLRDYLLHHSDSYLAQQMLVDAYGKAGNLAAMYESRAEVMVMQGRYDIAIDQLQTAHNHTDNDTTHNRLDGRIEQIRELRHQAEQL
ncbi:M48 family metalloprotease [Idiomarina tyrosinivorans]|nr:M48 family metalloprotease [Idiomarina tyrosinivorans]